MADITVNDIIAAFPEFAAYDVGLIQTAIDDAKLFINFKVWGKKANTGWKYFTAHLLKSSPTSSGGGGAAGAVTSEKVGDLSVTYGDVGEAGGNNSSTAYGRIFDQLMKTLLTTMIGPD